MPGYYHHIVLLYTGIPRWYPPFLKGSGTTTNSATAQISTTRTAGLSPTFHNSVPVSGFLHIHTYVCFLSTLSDFVSLSQPKARCNNHRSNSAALNDPSSPLDRIYPRILYHVYIRCQSYQTHSNQSLRHAQKNRNHVIPRTHLSTGASISNVLPSKPAFHTPYNFLIIVHYGHCTLCPGLWCQGSFLWSRVVATG